MGPLVEDYSAAEVSLRREVSAFETMAVDPHR
jgi:hypothetical protein